uniref:Uncharacterized protein n=1 Tax=Romanomermis culicivorax TaxID=13658 RepID=A0A915JVZ6_ROMCU
MTNNMTIIEVFKMVYQTHALPLKMPQWLCAFLTTRDKNGDLASEQTTLRRSSVAISVSCECLRLYLDHPEW